MNKRLIGFLAIMSGLILASYIPFFFVLNMRLSAFSNAFLFILPLFSFWIFIRLTTAATQLPFKSKLMYGVYFAFTAFALVYLINRTNLAQIPQSPAQVTRTFIYGAIEFLLIAIVSSLTKNKEA